MSFKHWSILFFLYSFSAFSQESDKQFAFRSLTVEEGLSQNSVVSIAQDSVGYMWFATQDGLNRYDGNTFTQFNRHYQDVTRSNYAQLGQLLTDSFGDLWSYSSSEIIERFNYKTQVFDSVASVKNGTVIFRKNLDVLWIGTLENGLMSVNLETQKAKPIFNEQLKNLSIFEIKTINASVYLGTNKGVFKIEDDTITQIPSTDNYAVSSIVKHNQNIVFGTYGNGLYRLDLESNTVSNTLDYNVPSHLNIQDLYLDSKSRLWIATYGEGLYLLSVNNKLQNFKANKEDPFALHYNDILKIYEDITGNIWFGSDGAGLSYYDEHLVKFNVLTSKQVPENVNVDVIRSIAVDNEQTIWLGTSGKGLTRANTRSKSFKTYTASNSDLNSDRIMSLLFVDNELWIGHQGKGLQIKNEIGQFRSISELDNQTIWKIYQDLNGDVWLCTRDLGLLKFNTSKGIVEHFNTNNSSLTSNNIRTVESGKKGKLWIGTEDKGLFVLDTETKYIERIDLITSKIKSLCFINDLLWIGTNGDGIISYDVVNKSTEVYKVDYGIANNVIYAILPDNIGNLWLSSNKGITRFNPEDTNKQTAENFTKINGLQAFEYNTGAYFKHNNGQLFFGGIDGVNWFDADEVTYNQAKPKTVLTKFEIFGEEEAIIQNAKFRHNQNTMTFTFAAMHFSEPEKNYYRYQLINNDENWTKPEYNNVAHYTNLPPNDYTFRVVSSNYEGVWNKVPITYSFAILKPWYATNLAWVIYSLLLMLSIYTIYRYFKFRWDVKIQLELEHAETERLKKIDEFKTKLYTNISHEFRTPLTLISGPIDNQLSKEELSENDKKELNLVKQNANRLLNLVNQMLDLSLIDSGQLRLKVKQGNLGIVLKQIIAAFQYKANDKNINIQSEIHGLKEAWFDTDVVEKVTSNLLSNAIKYAPKGSIIYFNANQIEDTLVMAITNVNKAVGKKDLGKLFQRFYQDNKSSDGVGVGLALVKELVTLSKGSILANSLESNRIQFTVTLPVSKEAFDHSDLELDVIDDIEHNKKDEALKKSENESVLLIVEDDNDIRAFVKSIFSSTYKVIEAINGKEGIEQGKAHIPDLIISDIMMPILDGIDLCNALKYDELTSHIPIILLTAKVGEENEIEGLKTGADDYVTKPFSIEKLKLQVEQLIQSRKDLQKRFSQTLQFNSKEIEVSSVEHQFLERLKKVMDANIIEPDFNAEKLSKEMLMSRMQLHRKLKALTDLTTTEFLRSERLKLALPLLKKSDFTISEIAYKVGFNTPSYFIKSFKEVYKCTPSEYQA